MIFVFSEDREDTGLRLAVASLVQQCGEVPIAIFRPRPDADFVAWTQGFPSLRLHPRRPDGAYQWNCKPQVMLELLTQGEDEVVWLDADILVGRCPVSWLRAQAPEVLVVGQEAKASGWAQGSRLRTEGWGFPVGREWKYTLNTCVVRATPSHHDFLQAWADCLQKPEYVAWQQANFERRPAQFAGDQDALNALLGSTRFTHLPVAVVRSGRGLVHSGGTRTFSSLARVRSLFQPTPFFVHSLGAKPWIVLRNGHRAGSKRERLTMVNQEVSPYVALAEKTPRAMSGGDLWVTRKSALARLCIVLAGGHFALRGIWITAWAELFYLVKRLARR